MTGAFVYESSAEQARAELELVEAHLGLYRISRARHTGRRARGPDRPHLTTLEESASRTGVSASPMKRSLANLRTYLGARSDDELYLKYPRTVSSPRAGQPGTGGSSSRATPTTRQLGARRVPPGEPFGFCEYLRWTAPTVVHCFSAKNPNLSLKTVQTATEGHGDDDRTRE